MTKNILLGLLALVMTGSAAAADNPPAQAARRFQLGHTIYAKWQTMEKAGTFGCPLNSESDAGRSPQGTDGRWAQFARGTLAGNGGYVVVAASGPHAGVAYEVHGCIYLTYDMMGGPGGIFGFPTSDEHDSQGGRQSDFEGGNITFSATTGRCTPHPLDAAAAANAPGATPVSFTPLSPDSPDAPHIDAVNLREQDIPGMGLTIFQAIVFHATRGNVVRWTNEIVSTSAPAPEIHLGAGGTIQIPNDQQQKGAIATARFNCGLAGNSFSFVKRMTLVDADGNKSNPFDVTIACH